MGRSSFARVSGVNLDVFRPHGAWFDRGELAEIRRFLREGGLGRYERLRRVEAEPRRTAARPPPPPLTPADTGTPWDLLDVLVNDRSGWASRGGSRVPS